MTVDLFAYIFKIHKYKF